MSKGNRSKIDNLGRVVIPKSIRKALDVEANSEISMYVEDKKLIITKILDISLNEFSELTKKNTDRLLSRDLHE